MGPHSSTPIFPNGSFPFPEVDTPNYLVSITIIIVLPLNNLPSIYA